MCVLRSRSCSVSASSRLRNDANNVASGQALVFVRPGGGSCCFCCRRLPVLQSDFMGRQLRGRRIQERGQCRWTRSRSGQSRVLLLSWPTPEALQPRPVRLVSGACRSASAGIQVSRRKVHGPHPSKQLHRTSRTATVIKVDPELRNPNVNSPLPCPCLQGPQPPSHNLFHERSPESKAMSELKTQSETPRWVSELKSPPPYKSKSGGIPDPPGFPSQTSGSKVRATTPTTSASQG